MPKKTKDRKIRLDPELDKQIEDWLKLHPTYDFSKFARAAMEDKMYKDTPVTSQLDELSEMIDKKLKRFYENLVEEFNVLRKENDAKTRRNRPRIDKILEKSD